MSRRPKVLQMPSTATRTTTCREAVELSRKVGVCIHWRPNDVVNWMLPELDAAQVMEG